MLVIPAVIAFVARVIVIVTVFAVKATGGAVGTAKQNGYYNEDIKEFIHGYFYKG